METLSKIRKWVNRDDGRLFRVGNERVSVCALIGVLILVGAVVLWQMHLAVGIAGAWVIAVGVIGAVLLVWGLVSGRSGNGA